jgi:hypothetical protein
VEHLEARPGRPVGAQAGAEVVLGADLGIGDGVPQALGGGADVDLEDLLHGALQFVLEAAQPGGPRLGVLADPAVVDEADRHRVEEVELLPTAATGDHEPGVLEQLQVLHDAEAGHREALLEGVERLAVLPEQLVEQSPAGRVGEGSEHGVHTTDNT